MTEPDLQAKVEDLQILVAFQERALTDLNQVVLGFTARVERLEQELIKVRSAVENPAADLGPQDDPPPHY